MTFSKEDSRIFNHGRVENQRYWSRFGGKPDFKGALVIDLGCGLGSLCIDIALSGAGRVVGIDTNPRVIELASENLKLHYPQIADTVEFRCQNLRDTPESDVDYFVSKNAFEHVIGLDQVLAEMKTRLRPNGRLYTGFGPLWNSPFGDHGQTRILIPWGHAIFSKRFLVRWRNLFDARKVASIDAMGLNALSLAGYLRIFRSCGMEIVSLQVNASRRYISRLFSLIRRVPFLEEYFSHNIYCVMQKRSEAREI
jgi:SAM-dependent methyltransferase